VSGTELNPRERDILHAIVHAYIDTGEQSDRARFPGLAPAHSVPPRFAM